MGWKKKKALLGYLVADTAYEIYCFDEIVAGAVAKSGKPETPYLRPIAMAATALITAFVLYLGATA